MGRQTKTTQKKKLKITPNHNKKPAVTQTPEADLKTAGTFPEPGPMLPNELLVLREFLLPASSPATTFRAGSRLLPSHPELTPAQLSQD